LHAAAHGCSAEAKHREILRLALATDPDDRSKSWLRVRSMTVGHAHTPSEVLLREGGDER